MPNKLGSKLDVLYRIKLDFFIKSLFDLYTTALGIEYSSESNF